MFNYLNLKIMKFRIEILPKIISSILFILLLIPTITLIFGHVSVRINNYFDLARFYSDDVWIKLGVLVVIGIIYFLIINVLTKIVVRIPRNFSVLTLMFSVLFIITRVLWLLVFDVSYFWDMQDIVRISSELANNMQTSLLQQGYLFNNPANLIYTLFVTRFRVILEPLFPGENFVFSLQILNILFLLFSINIVGFLIYKFKAFNSLVIYYFLSLVFVPFLSYNFFIYPFTMANFFYVVTFSLVTLFFYSKEVKWIYLFLGILSLVLANQIKPSGLVILMAIIIFAFIHNKQNLVRVILLSISIYFISTSIIDGYILKNYPTLEQSYKLSSQVYLRGICVGTSFGVDEQTPGFVSNTCSDIWLNNIDNPDKITSDYLKQIGINFDEIDRRAYWNRFIVDKLIYQWADGTFETDIMNNIAPDSQVITEFSSGSTTRNFLLNSNFPVIYGWYSHVSLLFIYIAVIFKITKKITGIDLFASLIVLGYMIFFLIWEISPHYGQVVLPIILFLSVDSINNWLGFYNEKSQKLKIWIQSKF